MIIGQIRDGIVLDHITAGRGMDIYNILHLGELDCLVTMILSASSSCDIPLSVRSFKIIFFVSIIITSVIFIISINLQSEKQPAVAIIYCIAISVWQQPT